MDLGILTTLPTTCHPSKQVAHWLLRHFEECGQAMNTLPQIEIRRLRMFAELEADQVAVMLLAR